MTSAAHALVVLGGALALDLVAGEPPNAMHPVVWMGRFYAALRRRAPAHPAAAFAYGGAMALLGPLVFGGGAWLVGRALGPLPLVAIVVEIYLLKSALSLRMLGAAASTVARALATGDVAAARFGLRSLVSRDTALLDEPLIAAAAVESVAENASDSLVAPLCFFVIGGVPAALAYRACNTLDAMIGYHGPTEWLGKAAARLDDAANLLPARVTAALLVVASALGGASASGALRIWWRDAARTESPNAGRPMAAMAGALGVQLEKVGCYRLGDARRPVDAIAIERSV
ncbi:MAG: adenosylcobinamide-phosphate synthase CbiB, partial [Polyangia bacterium]